MHLSARRWQDQLTLLLGLWLVVSPWAFGYPADAPQAINAYVAGLAMAILAAFDLYKTYVWAVVVNMLIGIWVAVSPWVLGMAGHREMLNNSVVIGVAVVVLALWELRSDPELHKQWAGSAS
ncbi:MAG: SPW repeat protein [Pseudomonadota bacterium]